MFSYAFLESLVKAPVMYLIGSPKTYLTPLNIFDVTGPAAVLIANVVPKSPNFSKPDLVSIVSPKYSAIFMYASLAPVLPTPSPTAIPPTVPSGPVNEPVVPPTIAPVMPPVTSARSGPASIKSLALGTGIPKILKSSSKVVS